MTNENFIIFFTNKMEKVIQNMIQEMLVEGPTFNKFAMLIHRYTTQQAHSIQEIRKFHTTKTKGDLFESFCCLYLKHVSKYEKVWLLKEVPEEVRTKLQLKSHDMGIDIVVENKQEYFAVQCKWKSPLAKGQIPGTKYLKKEKVNWGELATFLVLCERTGPWKQYLVMTNAEGIRREGRKSPKDKSICLKTFQNLKVEDWYSMSGYTGQILTEEPEKKVVLSVEEMRQKRLDFLNSTN
jgi:hypothetical protein